LFRALLPEHIARAPQLLVFCCVYHFLEIEIVVIRLIYVCARALLVCALVLVCRIVNDPADEAYMHDEVQLMLQEQYDLQCKEAHERAKWAHMNAEQRFLHQRAIADEEERKEEESMHASVAAQHVPVQTQIKEEHAKVGLTGTCLHA
jgi:hypothetical protein